LLCCSPRGRGGGVGGEKKSGGEKSSDATIRVATNIGSLACEKCEAGGELVENSRARLRHAYCHVKHLHGWRAGGKNIMIGLSLVFCLGKVQYSCYRSWGKVMSKIKKLEIGWARLKMRKRGCSCCELRKITIYKKHKVIHQGGKGDRVT